MGSSYRDSISFVNRRVSLRHFSRGQSDGQRKIDIESIVSIIITIIVIIVV
jgi:hypothetical protein